MFRQACHVWFVLLAGAASALGGEPLATQAARGWKDEKSAGDQGQRPRSTFLGRLFGERENQAQRDWEATLRCRDALAGDPDLARLNVDVSVNQGVAALSGPAPTVEIRNRAETIVRGVKGIRAVENRLLVANPRPSPPMERPRAFPPLESFPRADMGPSVPRVDPPRPPPPVPPKAEGVALQTRPDGAASDGARMAMLSRPVMVESAGDERSRLARILRDEPAWRSVRFRAEDGVIVLSGQVRTRGDRDALIQRLQSELTSTLRDQVRIAEEFGGP